MDIRKSAVGIEVLDLYPAAENCPHFLTIIADRTKGAAFRYGEPIRGEHPQRMRSDNDHPGECVLRRIRSAEANAEGKSGRD